MRDYAKKSRITKQKLESNGSWILVALFFCTVFFVAYISYHFSHEKKVIAPTKPLVHKHAPMHAIKKPIKKHLRKEQAPKKIIRPEKPTNIAALNPADIQPKYDFYKLLPAIKVTVPTRDQSTYVPTPSK